jgi:hypothetical protein
MSKFVDTIVLKAGHSIMVPNLPKDIKLEEFNQKFLKKDPQSIEQFGFFGSDYNTYFPGVNKEDFNPEDGEFIEPVFRLLSNCIVSKNWCPTEFPEQVLKDSMPLLIGQTVNCDHETSIGNAIGSVKSVYWQDAYKIGDKTIPGGINGVLKIDGKANPRIARGINMDPPSIHSNSVTVQFEWVPSHEFEDPYEFYEKMGTYDKEGKLIRRIAKRIISYKETSLVAHGADPYAQLIKDGKIINPTYADSVYSSFSENVKEKLVNGQMAEVDYKNILSLSDNTHIINNKGEQQSLINNNPTKEMNKELKEFLESLFGEGLLKLSEGAQPSAELVISGIKQMVQENQELVQTKTNQINEVNSLKEQVSNLQAEAKTNASFIEIGKNYFKEVKDDTVASYKKLAGENPDTNILTLIESITSLDTLKSLQNNYKQSLEEKFPLQCSDCGSHNISRGSAVKSNNEGENSNSEKKSTQEVLDTISKTK